MSLVVSVVNNRRSIKKKTKQNKHAERGSIVFLRNLQLHTNGNYTCCETCHVLLFFFPKQKIIVIGGSRHGGCAHLIRMTDGRYRETVVFVTDATKADPH